MVFHFPAYLTTGELLFPEMTISQSSCSTVSIARESADTKGRLVIYDTYLDSSSKIHSIVDFDFVPLFYDDVGPLVISTSIPDNISTRVLAVHGVDGFLTLTNFSVRNTTCSGENSSFKLHMCFMNVM